MPASASVRPSQRNPDQAEVVDHYRRENLPGEDEPDGGRSAEAWGEDYRSEDEERAEQTARPRPPRCVSGRTWLRQGALHHQRRDGEGDCPDAELHG